MDAVVLDFPVSLALWNGGAQSVHFRFSNWRKLGVFAPQLFRGTYQHPIGLNQFQNAPGRVAKFGENWFRDVEEFVDWKEK